MKLEDLKESAGKKFRFPRENFERMVREKEYDDSKDYELLYDFVADFDPTWMPYGTAKARDGDPYEWIADHLDEILSAIKKHAELV